MAGGSGNDCGNGIPGRHDEDRGEGAVVCSRAMAVEALELSCWVGVGEIGSLDLMVVSVFDGDLGKSVGPS